LNHKLERTKEKKTEENEMNNEYKRIQKKDREGKMQSMIMGEKKGN
jgi:hypothetical protein